MKYAAVVLRNIKNPFGSVDYEEVADALLAGGVFLEEVVLFSYENDTELPLMLKRLLRDYNGVFVVCDRALIPSAKSALESFGAAFEGSFGMAGETLVAALVAGEEGVSAVREGMKRIDAHRNNSYLRVVLCAISVPQETLVSALQQAEEAGQGKLTIHASEKFGCVRVEMIYDKDTPKMIADEVLRILASELKDCLYALEDVSIAERLLETLTLHRLKIAVAESFTGGAVSKAIVSVPGASKVFYEGLNTYDSKAKAERLGVSEYTLMSKGAVSEEVAYEMAAGLIAQGHCDVSIATTGNAGPTAEKDKPVGLCYLAVGTKERVRVFRFQLAGDRERVTRTAVNLALFLAYKEIK